MSRVTRRRFLESSVATGAGLILIGTKASGNIQGANDRVRIAVAGLNGRGGSHMGGWMGQKNVELAYVCDVDENVRSRALKSVQSKTDGQYETEGINDIRQALEDKNVDAISIATPNHWHSLMTIWGAQAGKHVYVEKPMSHDVEEGRVAVAAQKKYGVVIQHGTQRRSDADRAGLHEAIQAGKFGKLKISYGYACKPRGGIGIKPVTEPPSNLDWNMWRGPADIKEFHGNLVHYNWHWFWKSGNGELNNQGTHQLDVARWALDKDQTHPVRAMAIGGRFQWDDQGETPNTMFGLAEYPNGQQAFFNVRNVNYNGYAHQVLNEYYFEDGGKILPTREERNGRISYHENKLLYYPKGSDKGEPVKVENGHVTPGGNWGAFIAAVRAGDPSLANGNALDAHYACVMGHLMNNSYRLGKEVPFNGMAAGFSDNPDATEHFLRLHEVMSKGVGVKEGEKYTVGPWLAYDPQTERHTGEHAEAANALLKDNNREGFVVPSATDV